MTTDQSLTLIGSEQTKILYIQEFSLNYNRIMATLRDVASGIFYNELQKFDSTEFLSETIEIGVYSDEKY